MYMGDSQGRFVTYLMAILPISFCEISSRQAEAAGIKYDVKNWADVVGYEKEPIVKILEPQPV